MLQETNKNIQIYGITGSHLHKNIQDPEVAISGYSFIRKDRAKGFGGGWAATFERILTGKGDQIWRNHR